MFKWLATLRANARERKEKWENLYIPSYDLGDTVTIKGTIFHGRKAIVVKNQSWYKYGVKIPFWILGDKFWLYTTLPNYNLSLRTKADYLFRVGDKVNVIYQYADKNNKLYIYENAIITGFTEHGELGSSSCYARLWHHQSNKEEFFRLNQLEKIIYKEPFIGELDFDVRKY